MVALTAGELVGGRYCLEEVIGSGGMGDVWRARDRVLDRSVAVKLVYVGDPRKRAELAKDFLREARISAAIAHRNVVQIMDFGAHRDVPFMVLELLEGETLAHVLGRGDPLSFEWILAIVTQALEGLSAAHDAGVIHRDLKPENIFLVHEREGVYPKILDFGISKVLQEGSADDSIVSTRGGRVLGTPAYMSPEQARGLRNIDKRSDVYGMGVVLYELLSGSMPFFSENPGDLLLMIINETAPELVTVVPDVGQPLSDLVARAMSPSAFDRYADAHELRKALIDVADSLIGSDAARRLGSRVRPASWRKMHSESPTASHTTPPERAAPRVREDASTAELAAIVGSPKARALKKRIWFGAIGAAALLGIGLTAMFLGRSSAAPTPRFIVVSADDRPQQAPPAPQQAAPSAPVPVPEVKRAKASPEQNSGVGVAAQSLAQSFRTQKAGVVKCVNDHASELAQSPQLTVRLALSAEGKVEDAVVSPPELASSAVGRCIAGAVRSMRFAAQGEPISFQVPLTTKRGS